MKMKIEIVGLKVGRSRPTAVHTLDPAKFKLKANSLTFKDLVGAIVCDILEKSDRVNVRRVKK